MTKDAAFDIQLDIGTAQTHYATIALDAAAITGNGNGDFIVTHAGMTGTPLTTSVALLIGDKPADVVTKAVAVLNAVSDITDHMLFYAVGNLLYARLIEASANDGTMELGFQDDTCAGLTDDLAGTIGVGGVVKVETAHVSNISGPSLSVDTEDVTTHDQTTAFEELIATIIRSGEISLDIVYDPAGATHDAGTGLVYRLEDQIYSYFELIFPDAANTTWTFFGYVVGFEPSAPADGALTATVKIKITAAPTLA